MTEILLRDDDCRVWETSGGYRPVAIELTLTSSGLRATTASSAGPATEVFSLAAPLLFSSVGENLRLHDDKLGTRILRTSRGIASWRGVLLAKPCCAAEAGDDPAREATVLEPCGRSHSIALGASVSCAEVLDKVVHRSMGDVPTLYALCWSPLSSACAATDGPGPASLQSFAGRSLWILPASGGSVDPSTALRVWLADKFPRQRPDVATLLQSWFAGGSDQERLRSEWRKQLANTFSELSEPIIRKVYQLGPVQPHCLKVVPSKLGVVGVDCTGAFVPRRIEVQNCDNKGAVIVSVDLPTLDEKADFSMYVSPQAQFIPMGDQRAFLLQFAAVKTKRSRSPREDLPSPKAENPEVRFITFTVVKSRRSQSTEVPFVMPFSVVVTNNPSPVSPRSGGMPCSIEEFSKSNFPSNMTLLSVVDSCPLYRVVYRSERALPSPESTNTGASSTSAAAYTASEKLLMKVVKFAHDILPQRLREEVALVGALQHPNVVRMVAFSIDVDNSALLVIVPDYAQGSRRVATLRQIMFSCSNECAVAGGPDPFGWPQKLKVASDVAAAMENMHQFGMTAFRLNMDNVLVIPDDTHPSKVRAVVSGFGHVGDTCITQLSETLGDYPEIRAPELVLAAATADPGASAVRKRTKASNVFDFAMFLYCVTCRVPPFMELRDSLSLSALESRVCKEELRPSLSRLPADCPSGLVALMKQCWHPNVAVRPTASSIVAELCNVSAAAATPSTRSIKSPSCHLSAGSGTRILVSPPPGDGFVLNAPQDNDPHRRESSGDSSDASSRHRKRLSQRSGTDLPVSASVDDIWDLLESSPKRPGSKDESRHESKGSGDSIGSGITPKKNAVPRLVLDAPGRLSGARHGRSTSSHGSGDDLAQQIPATARETSALRIKIYLQDGSKRHRELGPDETAESATAEFAGRGQALINSKTREILSDKMIVRARREYKGKHRTALALAVCSSDELRRIRVTVLPAEGKAGGKQEKLVLPKVHRSATADEIFSSLRRRMDSKVAKDEHYLVWQGKALRGREQPLKGPQSGTADECIEMQAIPKADLTTVRYHFSYGQADETEAVRDLLMWRRATLLQTRDAISAELGLPPSSPVALSRDTGETLSKLYQCLWELGLRESTKGGPVLHLGVVPCDGVVVRRVTPPYDSVLLELPPEGLPATTVLSEATCLLLGENSKVPVLLCTSEGAVFSKKHHVITQQADTNRPLQPLSLVLETDCVKAKIGQGEFAWPGENVSVERAFAALRADLYLVFSASVCAERTHRIIRRGTYTIEHLTERDWVTLVIHQRSPSLLLLTLRVLLGAKVREVLQYVNAQLSNASLAKCLEDKDGNALPEAAVFKAESGRELTLFVKQ